MELNSDQRRAADLALDAILNRTAQGFTIVGEGGTGKTYSVSEIIRTALENGKNCLFTAPTHKAVKQLQKSCKENGLSSDKIDYATIHSALGLGLMPTDENKFVTPFKEAIVNDYDIVVLDESSMASRVLIENYLMPAIAGSDTFLLIMGDSMQLPPVKEAFSVAFRLFDTVELTQNQRQQNNPDGSPNGILQLARELRPAIRDNKLFKFEQPPANNVECVKDRDFLQAVLDFYNPETDLENTRILAWRNRRVDDINKAVRKKIYGPDADRFEVGERLVTTGSIKDAGGDVVLTSDEECILAAQKESTITDRETNDIWKTRLLTLAPCYADRRQVFAHVIHESEQERYSRRLSELKSKALDATGSAKGLAWRKFHQFNDLFSGISYAYCMTVHRSQGSTYDTVFLDVKDILDNRVPAERRKLLYVGMSRPSRRLVINKTSFSA